MKTILLFILISAGISDGYDQTSQTQRTDNPMGWTMVDQESEIRVYERWVTTENGLSVRERRGEFDMQAEPAQLATFILDVSQWKKWMSQVESSRIIGTKTPHRFYAYTRFSVPKPFSQRDLVSVITVSTSSDKRSYRIDLRSAEGVVPEYNNVTRVDGYKAVWTLTRLEENKVHVCFTALSSEPPVFPRWIQDPVIKRMFMNNLTNLKSEFHE